jgi:hypothetical protein
MMILTAALLRYSLSVPSFSFMSWHVADGSV